MKFAKLFSALLSGTMAVMSLCGAVPKSVDKIIPETSVSVDVNAQTTGGTLYGIASASAPVISEGTDVSETQNDSQVNEKKENNEPAVTKAPAEQTEWKNTIAKANVLAGSYEETAFYEETTSTSVSEEKYPECTTTECITTELYMYFETGDYHAPGETVDLPLVAYYPGQLEALDFTVSWDPWLELKTVKPKNGTSVEYETENGKCEISIRGNDAVIDRNRYGWDCVASLQFKLPENIPVGYYKVSIDSVKAFKTSYGVDLASNVKTSSGGMIVRGGYVPLDVAYQLSYSNHGSKATLNFTNKYKLSEFIDKDATAYDEELAHVLSVMAAGAYDQSYTLENLKALGFSNIHQVNYDDSTYGADTCGFNIAAQTINGELCVMIVLRGTHGGLENFGSDWQSNINILTSEWGLGGKHDGFQKAMDEVYDYLTDKVLKTGDGSPVCDHVKYFITGHSRGGGIGNLLAVKLFDKGVPSEDVFDYNFACPDTVKGLLINTNPFGCHNNIFNIGLAGDPVTIIPGIAGDVISLFTSGKIFPTKAINNIKSWNKYGKSIWFDLYSSNNGGGGGIMDLQFKVHEPENYVAVMSHEYSYSKSMTFWQFKTFMIHNLTKDTLDYTPTVKTVALIRSKKFSERVSEGFSSMRIAIKDLLGNVIAEINDGVMTKNAQIDALVMDYDDETGDYTFQIEGSDEFTVEISGDQADTVECVAFQQPEDGRESAVLYSIPIEQGQTASYKIGTKTDPEKLTAEVTDPLGNPALIIEPESVFKAPEKGDINHDLIFDVSDAVELQKFLAGTDMFIADWESADYCKDNKLNVFDLIAIKRALLK